MKPTKNCKIKGGGKDEKVTEEINLSKVDYMYVWNYEAIFYN
jgi:hypothetical protein